MEHRVAVFIVLLVASLACSCLAIAEHAQEWQGWKERHYKVYSSPGEEDSRLAIWRENYKKVLEHNMANHSFTLSLNQFADMVSFISSNRINGT